MFCAVIAIVAATGFTGQLIARRLSGRGIPLRLVARDEAKLDRLAGEVGGGVETAVADVTRPESLSRALEGARVVINCAGPFLELGEPVIAQSVRCGAHYLDTTGEQAFIKLAFERYGREAEGRGVAIAPATAFEYALADAAAELAARELQPCDEIEVIYLVSGFSSSRGTKKSILAALAADSFLYLDGRLVPAGLGHIRREVQLPGGKAMTALSFPGGEAILVPLHVRARSVIPMMAFDRIPIALLGAGLVALRAAAKSPLGDAIAKLIDRGSFGPTAQQRSASRFTILCRAKAAEQQRQVIIEGCDPYGVTAAVAAAVAERLSRHEPASIGAVSPSMIAGPELIVESLRAEGVSWDYAGAAQ